MLFDGSYNCTYIRELVAVFGWDTLHDREDLCKRVYLIGVEELMIYFNGRDEA